MHRVFGLLIGLLAIAILGCENDENGCKNDNDCREPRICEDGECVDPDTDNGGNGGASGTDDSNANAGQQGDETAGQGGIDENDEAGSGGEAGTGADELSLADGSYYEDPDRYPHVDILDSGASMRVYVVGDMPDDYCEYSNRGKLADDPSTGFSVSGVWIKYRAEQTYCGMIAEYALVSQNDSNELSIRSSTNSFEAAYDENTDVFEKK